MNTRLEGFTGALDLPVTPIFAPFSPSVFPVGGRCCLVPALGMTPLQALKWGLHAVVQGHKG